MLGLSPTDSSDRTINLWQSALLSKPSIVLAYILEDIYSWPMAATSCHQNLVEDKKLLQACHRILDALNDLCKLHDLRPDQVTLVDLERHTWPDASLGDPTPGRIYAQILTPGCIIRFQVDETLFVYHTSWDGPPRRIVASQFTCLDEDHPQIAGAMLDLAQRLNVSFSQIQFEGAKPVNSDVNIAEKLSPPESVSRPREWVVQLRHADRIYHYQGPGEGPLMFVADSSHLSAAK